MRPGGNYLGYVAGIAYSAIGYNTDIATFYRFDDVGNG